MAIQKKNEFIRSHVIVFVTWYLLLFVVGASVTVAMVTKHLAISAAMLIAGVALGGGFVAARRFLLHDDEHPELGQFNLRGLNSTIGPLPESRLAIRPAPLTGDGIFSGQAWWPEYKRRHPQHAKAMLAIQSLMKAKPDLPASPVPGGHGGATLIQHSLNVVHTIIEMVPGWRYSGHKNSKGEIVFPLLDVSLGEHRFAPDDPMPVLAAFAHDVGKVVCYEQRDGGIVEVKKNHDTEGARLLRALPEVQALPWRDRTALLLSCEYRHKPMMLPEGAWIDDRARSLMELLIAADVETGRREGGTSAAVLRAPGVAAQGGEMNGGQAALNATPAVPEPQAPPPHPVAVESGSRPDALDLTYSILLEGNRVNGTNAAKRIAWKHDGWLYINDAKLRAAVAERLEDSSYMTLNRGQMHSFTLELMEQLANAGHLMQEFEGARYSAKRAVFTTVSEVPGKKSVETRFVIIAKVDAFPLLARVPDCKVAPRVLKCSWGEQAAINKKAMGQAEQNSPGDLIAEAADQEDVPGDDNESMRSEQSGTDIDGDLPFIPDQDDAGDNKTALLEAAARLRQAVNRKEVPFKVREINGKKFALVESEVAQALGDEDWGAVVEAGHLLGVTGGSGKIYYGIEL